MTIGEAGDVATLLHFLADDRRAKDPDEVLEAALRLAERASKPLLLQVLSGDARDSMARRLDDLAAVTQ